MRNDVMAGEDGGVGWLVRGGGSVGLGNLS